MVSYREVEFTETSLIANSWYADSRFAPSQWETSLQSNAVSNWLGANLECSTFPLCWWLQLWCACCMLCVVVVCVFRLECSYLHENWKKTRVFIQCWKMTKTFFIIAHGLQSRCYSEPMGHHVLILYQGLTADLWFTWKQMTCHATPKSYRQVSNISRTKSQHLKDSRTVLRLSLPNPLKPDVKSRMKM